MRIEGEWDFSDTMSQECRNDMNDVTDTVGPEWAPSPAQQRVAELLASGYSQNAASKRTKSNVRTIQRWWQERLPDGRYPFREYVYGLRRVLYQNVSPQFAAIVDKALKIVDLVLDGEVKANDDRVQLAREILKETLYPVQRERGITMARSEPDGSLDGLGTGGQPLLPENIESEDAA